MNIRGGSRLEAALQVNAKRKQTRRRQAHALQGGKSSILPAFGTPRVFKAARRPANKALCVAGKSRELPPKA